MTLEFWFDVVCPYAWLASTAVEELAARAGAKLVYKPVLLGGLYKAHASSQNPAQTMSAPRAVLDLRDRVRQAERLGVTVTPNPKHPIRSVKAMRLVLAASDPGPIAADLFRLYHVDGGDFSDDAVLDDIAQKHGLEPGCYRDPAMKAALFAATAEGVERGLFGVPSLFVDDGPMIWGVDQLHFVEEQLGLPPREPIAATRTGAALTFFHDFSSPYSYLASTRIQAIADRHQARLELVPILLGGLFRSIGTADVPLATFSEAKQRWNGTNLQRWATHWQVPFRFPEAFPLRTVAACRIAIAEPASTPTLYEAAWGRGLNIGDPQVLAEVLTDAGFDAAALLARTADPTIKAQLRANTERAQAAGCCGVPSFLIDGEVLFWGQDRFDMVEAALQGWRPSAEQG